MQASAQLRLTAGPSRTVLLAALFVVAAAMTWSLQAAPQSAKATTRWPTDEGFYAVPGLSVSTDTVDVANGNTFITRHYQTADDATPLTFILTTSQNIKTVYRAGPDVPFLGSGYEGVPVPADLEREAHGWGVTQLRRGDSGWLQLYVYGERRGPKGIGVLAWGLGIFDTVIGQPNDYYLVRVLAPTTIGAHGAITRAAELADVLFPRVVEWYGR